MLSYSNNDGFSLSGAAKFPQNMASLLLRMGKEA
jgi:hypothetical protein